MKLENEFTVPASIDEAWALMLDVPRVAPCLPGATVEADGGEDGEYRGAMKIKIGPITASYKGTVKIEEADEAAHRVAMRAQAKDARGQGTAGATITSTMEETPEGTKVRVETDMRITGPAAQFGRGVMQDVSAKLMKQFAECLAEQLSTPTAPQAPEAQKPRSAGRSRGAGGRSRARRRACPAPRPSRPRPQASSGASTASPPPQTDDVLDLGEASRDAVIKRAVPVIGAMIGLLILLRIVRR